MAIVQDSFLNDVLNVPQDRLLKLHYMLWDIVADEIAEEYIDCNESELQLFDVEGYIELLKRRALDFMCGRGDITLDEYFCVIHSSVCFLCAYAQNVDCGFCRTNIKYGGLIEWGFCLDGLYYRLLHSCSWEELYDNAVLIRDAFKDEE